MSIDKYFERDLLFELLKVKELYDYRVKLELSEKNIPLLVGHYMLEEKSPVKHVRYSFDGKVWSEEKC